jgi:hypothetical protein
MIEDKIIAEYEKALAEAGGRKSPEGREGL